MHWVARVVNWSLVAFFKREGWTIEGSAPTTTRKFVIIAAPHTSNWDFIVMLLAKWAIGVPARFWGKDSLFRVPLLGAWMRRLGGIPLDRHAPRGAVGEMVALMTRYRQEGRLLWLALSPEGTRRRSAGWRSGGPWSSSDGAQKTPMVSGISVAISA